ncbi:hypothetical protein A3I40_01765 [Candidatus Uhrbacteria bacterium RIFCSPLOWO2_02_FULL_48_12]|uniref:Capsule synthesis protein CapA domain-containing protein n=1 Tax=Candidatus Uhrbacteria bacterium RIFCSPLOWO2_02_FULL_48_12 TaxID=1802407 RepID=A0A1F7V6J2_9BACT|nr:MAG: hypothetical protein A3I40_01765 [Candidatus Uhrbacteria bacterium RIFCSPLOWO2_02_FULL_48_12]
MRRIFLVIGLGSAGSAIVTAFIFYNLQLARVASLAPMREVQTESSEPSPTNIGTVASMAAAESQPSIIIFAVGDIMLGRNVEGWMIKEGLDYPFRKVNEFFKSADLAIGNLEGPIRKKHTRTPTGSTTFNFKSEVAAELKNAGVGALSLSNNHTFDYGPQAFEETKSYLRQAGIDFFGHPHDIHDDYVLRKEIGGQKFAFIGLQDVFASMDSKKAVALIKRVAAEPNTTTIVSIHWGDEYKPIANQRQKTLAREFIDAGADVVIGHHPHVVQNVELYKGRPIFYSLGNFIFDQYFSKETQEGLAIGLEFKGASLRIRLYPVDIIKSQPVLMEDFRAREWLKALSSRSEKALSEPIREGIIVTSL